MNKEDDATCGPYRRSLLYLVSESFEGGEGTPIPGMEKYFDPALAKLKDVSVHVSLGKTSTTTTHCGFDNDAPTKKHVIKFIKQCRWRRHLDTGGL